MHIQCNIFAAVVENLTFARHLLERERFKVYKRSRHLDNMNTFHETNEKKIKKTINKKARI